MYKRIMIVVDDSEVTKAAVREGLTLAKQHNSEVHFFHVLSNYVLPIADGLAMGYLTMDEHRQEVERTAVRLFTAATSLAKRMGVTSSVTTGSGAEAAVCIVEAAIKQKCGLIVVGSHGRNALERLIFGSVVTRLITLATVPVLVCKNKTPAKVQPGAVKSVPALKRKQAVRKPATPQPFGV
ncbi:MAG: universal stress protein [Casimicrobium sp.]